MITSSYTLTAGPLALYAQVASIIRGRIGSGTWRSGDELPPIEELCASFGVSRITVRQAIQILVSEGLLSSRRGRRVTVTAAAEDVSGAAFKNVVDAMSELEADHRIDLIERTDGVEVPAGVLFFGTPAQRYARFKKVHSVGGAPYCLMDIAISQKIADRLPAGVELREKLAPLLMRYARPKLAAGRERIVVAAADFEEAHRLDYPMAGPVARMTRIMCDEAGCAIYFGRYTYRGDRFGVERDHGPYVKQAWDGLRGSRKR